jgi:hypothetical protein
MSFFLLTEYGERLVQENGGALILDQQPADRATFPRRATNIFLAEVQAYDPDSSSVITWYFSSGKGFNNSGTFYVPRIENPATFSRSMSGALGGRVSPNYGELTILNPDGAIDAIGNDYFDGRTLTLKYGDSTGSYAAFTTILTATIESVALEKDRVSIRLRDKTATLEKPFSTAKYGGTNTLPTGVDGTPDDIKDQSKPRIFGRIALMTPVLVNTSKLIYQVNDGAIDSIVNVYDGGAYLTRSSDYLNLSDMYTYDPPEGTYRSLPSLGLFRLGSTPFKQLSVCVVEEWDYISNSAAGIIQRILTEKGYTASDWVAADFTTLNQKNAGSLGIIVGDGETTASLIDRICASVGAWWGFDAVGKFRIGRFDAPSGVAVATLTDNFIIDCEREPEGQLPYWRTVLNADTNFVVQDKNALSGIVPDYRASWLGLASRDQKAENATVKTTRLLADEVTYESSLNGISIAQAEAARRLNLFSVRRDVVNLTLATPQDYFSTIELGSVVNLQSERLGYGLGRLMTVTSLSVDYQSNTLDLILWG